MRSPHYGSWLALIALLSCTEPATAPPEGAGAATDGSAVEAGQEDVAITDLVEPLDTTGVEEDTSPPVADRDAGAEVESAPDNGESLPDGGEGPPDVADVWDDDAEPSQDLAGDADGDTPGDGQSVPADGLPPADEDASVSGCLTADDLPAPLMTPAPGPGAGARALWVTPPWPCVSAWTLERSDTGAAGPFAAVAQVLEGEGVPAADGQSVRFEALDGPAGGPVRIYRLVATTAAGPVAGLALSGIALSDEPIGGGFDVQGARLARAKALIEAGLPPEEVLATFQLTRSVVITPEQGQADAVSSALSKAGLTDVRVASPTLVIGRLALGSYASQLGSVAALPGIAKADVELVPGLADGKDPPSNGACAALLKAVGLEDHEATGLDYEAPPVVGLEMLVLDDNASGHGPAVGSVVQCLATLDGKLGAPIVPLVPIGSSSGLLDSVQALGASSYDILQVSLSGIPSDRWSDPGIDAALKDRLVVSAAGNFGYSSYYAALNMSGTGLEGCASPPCPLRHSFGNVPYLEVHMLDSSATSSQIFLGWKPDGTTLELQVTDETGASFGAPEAGAAGMLVFTIGAPKTATGAPAAFPETYRVEVRWTPPAGDEDAVPELSGATWSSDKYRQWEGYGAKGGLVEEIGGVLQKSTIVLMKPGKTPSVPDADCNGLANQGADEVVHTGEMKLRAVPMAEGMVSMTSTPAGGCP